MIEIGISPVAFSLGPVTVTWYGIMVALAVLTLILWALHEVKRGDRLTYEQVFNGALFGIPFGVIGARLVHVLDQLSYYIDYPGQILGDFGRGLAIYGAVLGAALGIWVYSRFSKVSFGHFADMLAPGIILAQAIGRVGCTLNGCCYGIATDLPWAVCYTHQSHGSIIGPVHPTQIYEIIYNLIIFAVLVKLRGRFRPAGSLFLVYLTFYSLWRIAVDFIREGTPFLFGLHEAQVISIVTLIITVTLLAWRTRWVKREKTESEG